MVCHCSISCCFALTGLDPAQMQAAQAQYDAAQQAQAQAHAQAAAQGQAPPQYYMDPNGRY
jgi:hypothetical protein